MNRRHLISSFSALLCILLLFVLSAATSLASAQVVLTGETDGVVLRKNLPRGKFSIGLRASVKQFNVTNEVGAVIDGDLKIQSLSTNTTGFDVCKIVLRQLTIKGALVIDFGIKGCGTVTFEMVGVTVKGPTDLRFCAVTNSASTFYVVENSLFFNQRLHTSSPAGEDGLLVLMFVCPAQTADSIMKSIEITRNKLLVDPGMSDPESLIVTLPPVRIHGGDDADVSMSVTGDIIVVDNEISLPKQAGNCRGIAVRIVNAPSLRNEIFAVGGTIRVEYNRLLFGMPTSAAMQKKICTDLRCKPNAIYIAGSGNLARAISIQFNTVDSVSRGDGAGIVLQGADDDSQDVPCTNVGQITIKYNTVRVAFLRGVGIAIRLSGPADVSNNDVSITVSSAEFFSYAVPAAPRSPGGDVSGSAASANGGIVVSFTCFNWFLSPSGQPWGRPCGSNCSTAATQNMPAFDYALNDNNVIARGVRHPLVYPTGPLPIPNMAGIVYLAVTVIVTRQDGSSEYNGFHLAVALVTVLRNTISVYSESSSLNVLGGIVNSEAKLEIQAGAPPVMSGLPAQMLASDNTVDVVMAATGLAVSATPRSVSGLSSFHGYSLGAQAIFKMVLDFACVKFITSPPEETRRCQMQAIVPLPIMKTTTPSVGLQRLVATGNRISVTCTGGAGGTSGVACNGLLMHSFVTADNSYLDLSGSQISVLEQRSAGCADAPTVTDKDAPHGAAVNVVFTVATKSDNSAVNKKAMIINSGGRKNRKAVLLYNASKTSCPIFSQNSNAAVLSVTAVDAQETRDGTATHVSPQVHLSLSNTNLVLIVPQQPTGAGLKQLVRLLPSLPWTVEQRKGDNSGGTPDNRLPLLQISVAANVTFSQLGVCKGDDEAPFRTTSPRSRGPGSCPRTADLPAAFSALPVALLGGDNPKRDSDPVATTAATTTTSAFYLSGLEFGEDIATLRPGVVRFRRCPVYFAAPVANTKCYGGGGGAAVSCYIYARCLQNRCLATSADDRREYAVSFTKAGLEDPNAKLGWSVTNDKSGGCTQLTRTLSEELTVSEKPPCSIGKVDLFCGTVPYHGKTAEKLYMIRCTFKMPGEDELLTEVNDSANETATAAPGGGDGTGEDRVVFAPKTTTTAAPGETPFGRDANNVPIYAGFAHTAATVAGAISVSVQGSTANLPFQIVSVLITRMNMQATIMVRAPRGIDKASTAVGGVMGFSDDALTCRVVKAEGEEVEGSAAATTSVASSSVNSLSSSSSSAMTSATAARNDGALRWNANDVVLPRSFDFVDAALVQAGMSTMTTATSLLGIFGGAGGLMSALAARRYMTSTRVYECAEPDAAATQLDPYDHPLRFDIGGSYALGALVGNFSVVAFFAIVVYTLFSYRVRKLAEAAAAGTENEDENHHASTPMLGAFGGPVFNVAALGGGAASSALKAASRALFKNDALLWARWPDVNFAVSGLLVHGQLLAFTQCFAAVASGVAHEFGGTGAHIAVPILLMPPIFYPIWVMLQAVLPPKKFKTRALAFKSHLIAEKQKRAKRKGKKNKKENGDVIIIDEDSEGSDQDSSAAAAAAAEEKKKKKKKKEKAEKKQKKGNDDADAKKAAENNGEPATAAAAAEADPIESAGACKMFLMPWIKHEYRWRNAVAGSKFVERYSGCFEELCPSSYLSLFAELSLTAVLAILEGIPAASGTRSCNVVALMRMFIAALSFSMAVLRPYCVRILNWHSITVNILGTTSLLLQVVARYNSETRAATAQELADLCIFIIFWLCLFPLAWMVLTYLYEPSFKMRMLRRIFRTLCEKKNKKRKLQGEKIDRDLGAGNNDNNGNENPTDEDMKAKTEEAKTRAIQASELMRKQQEDQLRRQLHREEDERNERAAAKREKRAAAARRALTGLDGDGSGDDMALIAPETSRPPEFRLHEYVDSRDLNAIRNSALYRAHLPKAIGTTFQPDLFALSRHRSVSPSIPSKRK